LRGTELDVYDTRTSKLVRTFAAPAARSLDLQDGVAAYAHGRQALVLDLTSGKRAAVGMAPRPLLGVQLERPGLAYAWTARRAGTAQFVPMTQVERVLGR
jgi:hypothetical protein